MQVVGSGGAHGSKTSEQASGMHDLACMDQMTALSFGLVNLHPGKSGMISEQDVQTYKRDGVIVVPEVLGADTLAQLRSVISELVGGSAKTLEHADVYDL